MEGLFYRKTGIGDPLIILHGLFGSSDNWVSIAKVLSENYCVYLLDLRNHGQSFHDDTFTYEAMSLDVERFMRHHKLKDPVLLGHSMGGKVVMNIATNHREKVKGLIVVDIAPKYYPVHHQTILAGLNAIDLNLVSSRKEADKALSRYVSEPGIRQFLLKNLARSSEKAFYWKNNLPVINVHIGNVGEMIIEGSHYDGPTLFIDGPKSGYISSEDHESILEIFPKAEITEIPGAGHWVHVEQPAKFIEVVNKFLSEL